MKNNTTYNQLAVHSIVDPEIIPFDPIAYSKFKIGDHSIATNYGKELFLVFKKTMLPQLVANNSNFQIYSSPYDKIPTSSFYMTQIFFSEFNNYLNEKNFNKVTVKLSKIQRTQTYSEDYGALSADERYNLIKNDTYKFLNIPSQNDICIFIDDISITGTHQRIIENLLNPLKKNSNNLFLYYAKLNNINISPTFENNLNYFYVTIIQRLVLIILSNSYKITTRTVKKKFYH
jgi:hypothetical protein